MTLVSKYKIVARGALAKAEGGLKERVRAYYGSHPETYMYPSDVAAAMGEDALDVFAITQRLIGEGLLE